jgi:hypothetical protein
MQVEHGSPLPRGAGLRGWFGAGKSICMRRREKLNSGWGKINGIEEREFEIACLFRNLAKVFVSKMGVYIFLG